MVAGTLSTQTTELLASRGETTQLTVLVHRVAEPVDPWVVADSIVSTRAGGDRRRIAGEKKKIASPPRRGQDRAGERPNG